MFISAKVAIEKGWIKRADGQEINPSCIQPNAIDFTVDRVFELTEGSLKVADIEDGEGLKTVKEFPATVELIAQEDTDPKFNRVPLWTLEPRTSYDIASEFYVQLPEGVAALLIIRSTFNRGSVFLTSGLYDSGYEGAIGAALHNNAKTTAHVGKGIRVGQIIFVKSDSVGKYTGGYNHEAGTVWQDGSN